MRTKKNIKKVSTRNARTATQVNTTTKTNTNIDNKESQENLTENIPENRKDRKLNEVIRVKKRPSRYVMIDKTFLEDDRLSFKAKGILAYLLSKPDNWKVIVGDLVKRSTDGKAAVYSGLKELKECGYYEKNPVKNDTGKIIRWESIVYESPKNVENTSFTDFQEIENQEIENREHNNNYINNNYLNNNESCLVLSEEKKVEKKQREDKTGQDQTAATLKACEEIIKENIRYKDLCISYPKDKRFIDELVSIMLDVVMSKSEYISIGKEQKPRELVKSVIMKLDYDDIEQVISQFKNVTTKITRKKQYLLTMLYNVRSELEAGIINDLDFEYR